MSLKANKHLIRKYIDEVINTGNVEFIDQFISPDYQEVFDGTIYPQGIEGVKKHILGVRKTYPDLKVTINQQIAEDEWVATCITATGTHQGEWLGIKPTGKVLKYTGVNINKIRGGKIVEHGGAANMLGPLLESGAIKIV